MPFLVLFGACIIGFPTLLLPFFTFINGLRIIPGDWEFCPVFDVSTLTVVLVIRVLGVV